MSRNDNQDSKSTPDGNDRKMWDVFTVKERSGKSYWIRIGAAFGNAKGSITIRLDALPLGSDMVAVPK